MNIKELVEEGNKLNDTIAPDGYGIRYVDNIQFNQWASKCMLYLETEYPNSIVTEQFKEFYQKKLHKEDIYKSMLGTLNGVEEWEKKQA